MTKRKNRRPPDSRLVKRMIKAAREARSKSCAPWSGVHVGFALLSKSGKIYRGTNIESIIPDSTICAERTAVFKALSEGERSFILGALVAFKDEFIYPCGTCRQVLKDYAPNIDIIVSNLKGKYTIVKLADLLPMAYCDPKKKV